MSKVKFLFPIITAMALSACNGNSIIEITSNSTNSINSTTEEYHSSLSIPKEHTINNPKKTFNNGYTNQNESYIQSVKDFALDFYKISDSVFSPLSIATCYSMLYDCAKEESKAELEKMLHYNDSFNHLDEIKTMLLNNAIDDKDKGTYLDVSQSMWVHDTFEQYLSKNYADILQDYYFAEAFKGDLESDEMHELLTNYINDKTRNFLDVKKEVFKEYGRVMWLVNTIYMKSHWVNEFEEYENSKGKFSNIDSKSKEANYMNNTRFGSFYRGEKYTISSLNLNGNFTFTILLPDEKENYEEILSDDAAIKDMLNYQSLSMKIHDYIHYQIPQFKVQKAYDLNEELKKLGVTYIFDSDRANLSGISDKPLRENLYVARSRHEAGIELTNGGIEAAAYTIINIAPKSAAPIENPFEFVVDHPFAYVLSNREGLPLFMGAIKNI